MSAGSVLVEGEYQWGFAMYTLAASVCGLVWNTDDRSAGFSNRFVCFVCGHFKYYAMNSSSLLSPIRLNDERSRLSVL